MKSIKIITIALIIILISSLNTFSFATIDTEMYNPSKEPISGTDSRIIAEITANLLKYLQYIGIILAAVILSILGLKYMFGSLEERAEYKQNLIPYIAGCLLLVSVTTIPRLVTNIISASSYREPSAPEYFSDDIKNAATVSKIVELRDTVRERYPDREESFYTSYINECNLKSAKILGAQYAGTKFKVLLGKVSKDPNASLAILIRNAEKLSFDEIVANNKQDVLEKIGGSNYIDTFLSMYRQVLQEEYAKIENSVK